MTAAQEPTLKSYQATLCKYIDERVGFRGKRVLEVGGSLPRSHVIGTLGVSQWVAIEDMEYWGDGKPVDRYVRGDGSVLIPDAASFDAVETLGDYLIIDGKIENLPASFEGRFDVVVSMAAFQHVHMFAPALERIYEALVPGGSAFIETGLIWSAAQGHHLALTTDEFGRSYSFSDSPLPEWGHLLLSPFECYQDLCKKMDRRTAAEIVYKVYTSPRVNRFFVEDYVNFVNDSPFGRQSVADGCTITGSVRPVPPQIQAALEQRYPGRKQFGVQALSMLLQKMA